MATKYYTEIEVRKAFEKRCGDLKHEAIAADIGIHRQQVCAMLRGAPISKKAAEWAGFRPVNGLYELALKAEAS